MEIKDLKNQVDWLQARIEEMDKLVINGNPSEKGYKETIDAYNKFVDRYCELVTRLEHFDDDDLEKVKLELEQDKLNLDMEKLRLDREKFAYEVSQKKTDDVVNIVFRSADVGAKIAVPVISGYFAMKLAILAYTKNGDLELRDGTIWSLMKQLKM